MESKIDNLVVILDNGVDKYTGQVMRLTIAGMLIEMEKITFKVGTFMNASVQFESGGLLTERVRSVKHYDKFFRKPPPKRPKPGEEKPKAMKLCDYKVFDF
jgi:hypothetical protein